ncbi:MAG: hypothetical protein H6712_25950 [Myxococcales bacterium]|nr:hypothetical protein [Myxococcales bacterium]MCB9717319.1 hypothetical protein [Myxococcales bacterium]
MTTLSLLLSATFALAPTAAQPAESTPEEADDAAYVGSEGQTSVYEFADDTLTGEHLSPDGQLIPWRRPPHHESLIDLRGHFMPELVRLSLDL